jgi:hypothetical protein
VGGRDKSPTPDSGFTGAGGRVDNRDLDPGINGNSICGSTTTHTVAEGVDEEPRSTGVVSGRSGRQALMMTTKMMMPMKLICFIISIS